VHEHRVGETGEQTFFVTGTVRTGLLHWIYSLGNGIETPGWWSQANLRSVGGHVIGLPP
jgi:hypothetical protein